MKIYLEKTIFINRAPFEKLELDFTENEIAVLTAINGKGKTTLLSHIVDAYYEMARPHYFNEFEDKENKLYRISSSIYNLDQSAPSYVYIRFKFPEGNIDYVDIRNTCTEQQYNENITLKNKIPFSEIQDNIRVGKHVKKISKNFNKDLAKKIFNNNVLTYFPSYRYEQPGYLNDPYKVKLNFKKLSGFSGYLSNPIEVISGLPELANWLLDIILDLSINKNQQERTLFENLNTIITQTLISKNFGNLRFGIGPRGLGSSRIQIYENNNNQNDKQIYPTIFNLSSGESSILCLFGELLKHGDNNRNNIQLSEISGIVLVDEIDKHLHIKLQKDVLPKLLNLFPNIQFIVSSHSPFLNMGLAEDPKSRAKIIDLDNLGIAKDPIVNELYAEVYNMMIKENEKFKESYELLKQQVQKGSNPLIITEGKTDIQHIKKAKHQLNITNLDIDFYEVVDDWGDSKLKLLLEQLSKIPQSRKIIGIFDRDVPSIILEIEKNNQVFKDYGNNVYAFCIPIPSGREIYTNVSIEFYYTDIELKKTKDNKCIYFDNELNFDSKRKPISPITSPTDHPQKKVWCENIGDLDWIHTKAKFATLIETDDIFISDFNFTNFNLIFNKINSIITPPTIL